MRVAPDDTFSLDGRIGNQLCQLAACVGVALSLRGRPVIPADWAYRSVFSFSDSFYLTSNRISACTPITTLKATAHLKGRCHQYTQDIGLWWSHRNTVRQYLAPSPKARERVSRIWDLSFAHLPTPILSVHVRRGDNVTNAPGTINCLPLSYYEEAIGLVEGARSLVVFSDDPTWCRENLGHLADVVYEGVPRVKEWDERYNVDEPLDWIDLLLMARIGDESLGCVSGTHVLSNSTYSLWGAYLSNDLGAIAPGYWYGAALSDDPSCDPSRLMLPSWRIVPVADPNPLTEPAPVLEYRPWESAEDA